MFSTTLKRSAVTLGILGGFLAAAAPAGAVTMLDYEGSPVVTHSADGSRGDDRATGLKSDSNEVAVEGITLNRTPQRVTIDLVEELGADA